MPLFKFLSRRNRMQAYRQARREVEMISDADLADMGIKRYQLEAAANAKAAGLKLRFSPDFTGPPLAIEVAGLFFSAFGVLSEETLYSAGCGRQFSAKSALSPARLDCPKATIATVATPAATETPKPFGAPKLSTTQPVKNAPRAIPIPMPVITQVTPSVSIDSRYAPFDQAEGSYERRRNCDAAEEDSDCQHRHGATGHKQAAEPRRPAQ